MQGIIANSRFAALLAASLIPGAGVLFGQLPEVKNPHYLAPFVASPQLIVERMLQVAGVKPGELVFDLGSGDGRVLFTAAQKFQARATGIEISKRLVETSTKEALRNNLQDRVKVIHGDAFDADLREADVVTLYLLRDSNDLLRPMLERNLRPGARVVSHDYEIRGWKPAKVAREDVHKRNHTIYLYVMPPQK